MILILNILYIIFYVKIIILPCLHNINISIYIRITSVILIFKKIDPN